MPEIMRLAFKYKLRPNRKQEQAMRNFSGCCRFAYNALLAQEKEEYQEYLEELESRLCCGEALSKDEANFSGVLQRYPERTEVPIEINEVLVVDKALETIGKK